MGGFQVHSIFSHMFESFIDCFCETIVFFRSTALFFVRSVFAIFNNLFPFNDFFRSICFIERYFWYLLSKLAVESPHGVQTVSMSERQSSWARDSLHGLQSVLMGSSQSSWTPVSLHYLQSVLMSCKHTPKLKSPHEN